MTLAREHTTSSYSDTESLRLGPALLAFVPLIVFGNSLSELFRYHQLGVALLFLPYAMLTAALVRSRRRDWPWYIIIAAAVSIAVHAPRLGLPRALLAQPVDIIEALVATTLLLWLFDGRPRLDSIAALLRFFFAAVIVAPAVGGVLGAVNMILHDPAKSFGASWRAWAMSDALTGLTMLPALLFVFPGDGSWKRRVNRKQVAEGIIISALLVASCWLSLDVGTPAGWRLAISLYAPLPVLIWTALRFGAGATSMAYTGVMIAAVLGADRGAGPFVGLSIDERIVMAQLFVLLTSVPILFIAAISSARRASVELHQAILKSVHAQVAIIDARGKIDEVNESWRRFAETPYAAPYHRSQVGDNFVDVCQRAAEAGDENAARKLEGLLRVLAGDERFFQIEYTPLHEPGSRFELTVESLALPNGGAFVRRMNVTAQYQARVQMEEQRRQLTHLARVNALGQLSGALAHELNQPLSSILSNAEAARLLLKRPEVDTEMLDEILHDILTEDHRAAQVIRRLRAMLKHGETRLQLLDTAELIGEVLQFANAELVTRRVSVTTSVAPDVPPVLGDRVQVQQVLLNLILNASEAMVSSPERRILLSASGAPNGKTQISVRDSGPGIAPSIVDRLFEPFVTTKSEGLGLGLSISRTIVASHGGRLWADNNPDGGATVHCLFMSSPAPQPTNVSTPLPADRAELSWPTHEGNRPAAALDSPRSDY